MAVASFSQFPVLHNFAPPLVSLQSQFISDCQLSVDPTRQNFLLNKRILLIKTTGTTCSSPPQKLVRDPRLDKHVVRQKPIRFVQKLKTLLLSKPKHFMPIHILYKCRSYLSLPRPQSMIDMIRRYPTIFELFTIPSPPKPLNATGWLTQLCVRLTPVAAALGKREDDLKRSMGVSLARKLQKLLMLASPHHRILLSKLVHLGPDLGLPVNFRSRLCNDHLDKFKVVDTSYGRALELVSWDSSLASVIPSRDEVEFRGLIVDRPLKFKLLRLRKGLNVKRRHHDFLLRFKDVRDVCPYTSDVGNLAKESIEAENRACASVREVLGMTIEKRTLVDHLTHFRKEFCLPNKLRAMLVRHPELFYVSVKGQRDSVFLVEGYNEKGTLLEKDEMLRFKDQLIELVREGKRLRKEEKKELFLENAKKGDAHPFEKHSDREEFDDSDDGLDDLFELEEPGSEFDVQDYEVEEEVTWSENDEFWMSESTSLLENGKNDGAAPW